MKQSTSLNSGFSIIIGTFLLIEGIWGLSSEVVFGILTTNETDATIHIILGLIGIFLGIRQHARVFCVFLGVLLATVGVLRFIDGTGELIVKLFNANYNVAYLNILIGAAALAVTYRKTEMLVDQIPSDDDELPIKNTKAKTNIIANHITQPDKKEKDATALKTVYSNKKEVPKTGKAAADTRTNLKTVHSNKKEVTATVKAVENATTKPSTVPPKKEAVTKKEELSTTGKAKVNQAKK